MSAEQSAACDRIESVTSIRDSDGFDLGLDAVMLKMSCDLGAVNFALRMFGSLTDDDQNFNGFRLSQER